jgi:DNA replication protein DnaC
MDPLANTLGDPAKTPPASTRSPNIDEATFLERVRELLDGTLVATEPDEEREPPCSLCGGLGFVRHNVPLEHPDFGKAFPCSCMEPKLAAERVARVFGRAEIPPKLAACSFATYALLPGDQTARAQVERWATDGEGGLFLHGAYGVGKTGLAFAAFRQRLETLHVDGLFRTSPDLLEAIRATFDRETGGATSSQVTDAVKSVALLLLDDLGAEKVTEWVEERLYMIVNHRYLSGLATIYTSNLTLTQLGAKLSQRIAWRIKEMCEDNIIHVQGANLRDRPTRGAA